jgi:hypothetical protein
MGGSSDRRDVGSKPVGRGGVVRDSGLDDLPAGGKTSAAGRKSIKSVGRTHQVFAFLFLGLAVLAFGVAYYFGLINLPD